MLFAKVQALADALPADRRADLRVVLVSIDPTHDTPAALKALAAEHHLDPTWSLLTGDADTVRKVAAVLSFRYQQLPDGGFQHASTLVLVDGAGVELARAEASGSTNEFATALAASLR
jgi:protein SCO1/2